MTTKESVEKYKAYVDEHIENVKKVWTNLQPFMKIDESTFYSINSIIQEHDKSKYLPEEFQPYRNNFFTADDERKIPEEFDYAWVHHIANNPHHWEHWVTFTKGNPDPCGMPFNYVVEMLCDWTAMSYKFNNVPSEWFEQNKQNIIIHEITLSTIQAWLPVFDKVFETLKGAPNGK